MKTIRTLLVCTTTVLGALHISPACADTRAQLNLGPLQYTLTDLVTGDNLAPSLVWSSNWTLAANGNSKVQTGWSTTATGWGSTVYDPTWGPATTYWEQVNSPSTSLSATLAQGQQNVQVAGSLLQGIQLKQTTGVGNSIYTAAWQSTSFSLGANTQVSFEIVINSLVQSDANYGTFPGNSATNIIPSHAWINFHGILSAYGDAGSFSRRTTENVGALFGPQGENFEYASGPNVLRLTLQNTSDQVQVYQFHATAQMSVSDLAAPVPEPASYALMSLGLLGLVGVLRRRARREL